MAVDVSGMDNWIESTVVAGLAEAIRNDAKAFAEQADDVEPVWLDLQAYLVIEKDDGRTAEFIHQAGRQVTQFGNRVATAGNSVAGYLEESAEQIAHLEGVRDRLRTKANTINSALETFFWPGPTCAPTLTEFYQELADAQKDYDKLRDRSNIVQWEVGQACKEYNRVLDDVAGDLASLDDDGSHGHPWVNSLIDAGVVVVGAFFPPAGAAAGAAKTLYDEYEARQRELKEELPELSDDQINANATESALVRGGPQAMVDHLVGEGMGWQQPPTGKLDSLGQGAAGWAGSETFGDVIGDVAEWAWPWSLDPMIRGDGRPPPMGPHLPDPESAPWSAGVQEERAQLAKTKDYDGDGYTDPAFLPGSDTVKYTDSEPAQVVVVPPKGPSFPEVMRESIDQLAGQVDQTVSNLPPGPKPVTGPGPEPPRWPEWPPPGLPAWALPGSFDPWGAQPPPWPGEWQDGVPAQAPTGQQVGPDHQVR